MSISSRLLSYKEADQWLFLFQSTHLDALGAIMDFRVECPTHIPMISESTANQLSQTTVFDLSDIRLAFAVVPDEVLHD